MRQLVYIAGVDSGGSKTDIAFSSTNGKLLSYRRFGGTRIEIIGVNKALETIWGVMLDEIKQLGLPVEKLQAVALGLGGLDSAEIYQAVQKKARAIFPSKCSISIWNDAQIGLYSGTFGRPGVCVVAGTGSLIAGMNEQKKWKRVGGWGSVFDDEGSAFNIGRLAVRACLRAKDGTGPPTILSDYIKSALGLKELEAVVSQLTWGEELIVRVASLAPLVDHVAQQGDPVACRILKSEAMMLAEHTLILIDSLNMKSNTIPIILVGGCFNSLLFRETFIQHLSKKLNKKLKKKAKFVRPLWRPVVGALIAALESVGLEVSVRHAQRLGKSLSKVQ